MASIYSASIDLSIIDKSKITEKNGKKYYNINVIINEKENEYGQILSITENQTKEERESKIKQKYLGNGKLVWSDNKTSESPKQEQSNNTKVEDDLPF